MLGEFARIARFFRPLSLGFAGAWGLRDDAACCTPPPGMDLLVTTDAMVAGVHFLADDPPQTIARRLLRSNWSDLAAMGASPFAYTLVTALPLAISDAWLAAFAQALAEDQQRFGGHLVGGDSVQSPHGLSFSITALGLVPAGQALRRTVSKGLPAYAIYVSGTIGDATLGLALRLGEKSLGLAPEDEAFLLARHTAPTPRLALGAALRGVALAAIDISDGLLADIGHIATESGLEAVLFANAIPLSPPAQKYLAANPAALPDLVSGGEDYELAFVIDPAAADLLAQAVQQSGEKVTKIGVLQQGTPGAVRLLDAQHQPIPLQKTGWTHF